MAATTDGNQNYKRYTDTPGVESPDQPASTAGTVDPGTGWTTQPYLNFNGDYVRHDENNDPVGIISSYVRHDENGDVVIPQPYVRRNDNNQPV